MSRPRARVNRLLSQYSTMYLAKGEMTFLRHKSLVRITLNSGSEGQGAERGPSRRWPCFAPWAVLAGVPLGGHGHAACGCCLPRFLADQVRQAGHLAPPPH